MDKDTSLMDAPTDVYRLFDSDWSLLYVGISHNAFWRFKQHRKKAWWPRVYWVQIFTYSDRYMAEAVEAAAIADEGPEFNIDRGSRRARLGRPMIERSWYFELDYFDEHVSGVPV